MTPLLTVTLSEENGQFNLHLNNERSNTLDIEAVDRLIEFLGRFRAQQSPPVRTTDPVSGTPVEAVLDPRWWLEAEPLSGGALMHVRHPGLGWQAYVLPPASLFALREVSTKVAEAMEGLAKQQSKPN